MKPAPRVDDDPLGIGDIVDRAVAGHLPDQSPLLEFVHWYWCRRHDCTEPSDAISDKCIRIGPFMSKGEAQRCAQAWIAPTWQGTLRRSLGMDWS